MNNLTVKSAFKMGEPHEQYGQTWYAQVEELEVPVMFNLMVGSVQELDRLTFETQEVNQFKSGKNQGKEYRRLKKVKVEQSQPRFVEPNSLEERVRKLEEVVFPKDEMKLHGEDGEPKVDVEDRNDDSGKDEIVLDDIDDEPVNLDDLPF